MATLTTNLSLSKAADGETFPLVEWKANMDTIDTHLAKLHAHATFDAGDNPDEDSWLTWASGWESFGTGNHIIRRGQWGFIEVSANRTGAAINNGSTGDIGNIEVATVDLPWRPAQHTSLITMGQGRLVGGYFDKDGRIMFTTISNSNDFNTNHKWNAACWYLLESAD